LTALQVIFYIISVFILGTGLLAVTTRKIFRSAIWLLSSLIGIAALFFWMQMEFIAAVQIVVYVSGIVVLIIFSIFLTQQSGSEMPKPVGSRRLFAVLAVLLGFALSYSLIYQYQFTSASNEHINASVSNIGSHLLNMSDNGYALPFEVVSILLLAAMIGCIVIAMKGSASSEKVKIEKKPRTEKETVAEIINS
jgi:NADH-quinone oxidoreductase subunit J